MEPELDEQPAIVKRRRVVTAITMVVGALMLGATLDAPPASPTFYLLAAAVTVVWIVGSLASGPLCLRRRGNRPDGARELFAPAGVGVLLYGLFFATDLVARRIPVLSGALHQILSRADNGPAGWLVVVATLSGLGEEMFFRGALYSAVRGPHAVVWTTLAYALVTVATGNLALVAASVVLGAVTALERRSTGGILAPAVSHVLWSALIILALPR